MAELNNSKATLEGVVIQWEVYEDATERLEKWLTTAELSVHTDEGLQATLPEKRAQVDRVKVGHEIVVMLSSLIITWMA